MRHFVKRFGSGRLLPWYRLAGAAIWASLSFSAAATSLDATPRSPGQLPRIDETHAIRLALDAVGREMPDFQFLDRYGKPVRISDFRGKPLLVSFIYTGCFEICPTQTRTLHEAVKGLDAMLGEDHFNVVSIGFNQPFDDSHAMNAFATQHRINHRNWAFLSPATHEVDALTQSLGFSWVSTPAGFDHVLGVTIIDAEGRVHSQVLGEATTEQLGTPLRRLLLYEQPQTLTGAVGLFDRVRILCTVFDEKTGEYRYDWKLIFQLISGLLFFLTMFIWLFAEWRRQRRQRRDSPALQSTAQRVISGEQV